MTPTEWIEQYENLAIRFLASHETFDGSQLCAHARRNGLDEPHHHNCWVSMLPLLQKRGYITKLPGTVPGSEAHSHNLNVHRWQSLLYK